MKLGPPGIHLRMDVFWRSAQGDCKGLLFSEAMSPACFLLVTWGGSSRPRFLEGQAVLPPLPWAPSAGA